MTIAPLPKTGNSSKFLVTVNKRGTFVMAFSYSLRTARWGLATPEEELQVASDIAHAIVSRHNPKLPFREKYIFAEHNTEPSPEATINYLRRVEI